MKKDREDGFTLLEIMVVLFLISLIAVIVVPRLSWRHSSGIKKSTRTLVREFRVLHWEAISRQEILRLDYDLDHRRISASIIDPSGTIKSFQTLGVHDFTLSGKVRISLVNVLHEGKVSDGKTFTQFFPSGSVEPTRIFLEDSRGARLTIAVRPLSGRVRVMKGRVERKKMPPPFYGPPSGDLPSLDDTDEK